MRILLVSQMYPGPADPDLGVFVAGMEGALRERGHEIELAVLDRRGGGKLRYLALARRVRRSRRPDYLRRELETKLPSARGKVEVIDMGVDTERFHPGQMTKCHLASPAFLCVGALSERKNVVRLADAFGQLGEGSLTFVGDGPLRAQLEGRERVRVVGRVPHDDIPTWLAAADVVVQPSLLEPFGQALVEAMACGRTVVATRIGGPPEFVTEDAGVLVDPTDVPALARALRTAASFPKPNDAARAAALEHDVRIQAAKVEAILQKAVADRRA